MANNLPTSRKRRGRGEGGVHQRKDGLWVGSLSLGSHAGKRHRRDVYAATKQEAMAKLRDLQQRAGQLPDSPALTVGAWLERWLTLIESTVEPNTLIPYRRHVRLHLAPRIGGSKLLKFRPADVEHLYSRLLKDGMSGAMVRKVGTTLSVALNHAVRSSLIPANPTASVRRPKAVKPDIEILDATQFAALVKACRGVRLGPLFLLMLDSGVRPGEALALTWKDVDFDAGRISVTKSLEEIGGKFRVKKPKTASSIRQIDVSHRTIAALATHRKTMLKEGRNVRTGPIFIGLRGGFLATTNIYRDSFKPLLEKAGLPLVSLHALRHTCATMLLAANVNPKIVSERLGHSSITITMDTYSHCLPGMQRGAADVMGKAMG